MFWLLGTGKNVIAKEASKIWKKAFLRNQKLHFRSTVWPTSDSELETQDWKATRFIFKLINQCMLKDLMWPSPIIEKYQILCCYFIFGQNEMKRHFRGQIYSRMLKQMPSWLPYEFPDSVLGHGWCLDGAPRTDRKRSRDLCHLPKEF